MTNSYEQSFAFGRSKTTVVVGHGVLDETGRRAAAVGGQRALVVSDETVAPLFAEPLLASLAAADVSARLVTVSPGDASKTLSNAELCYRTLADMHMGRDGLVVGLGGGVVTDLAGFVAGTWMRGIASMLCPTTLEADIDAAIGGKTAVNLSAGKNLVGVFHHPAVVVADTNCLSTLPDRDLSAGLAEAVKHGLIDGEELIAWHEDNKPAIMSRDPAVLAELIQRNICVKAGIVSEDEREMTGRRALLNFGHTLGHAIEAAAGYSLRHGECVGLGMLAAIHISTSMGLCHASLYDRVAALLMAFNLPTTLPPDIDRDQMLSYLPQDKKARAGIVRFVLIEQPGTLGMRDDVQAASIDAAIQRLGHDS